MPKRPHPSRRPPHAGHHPRWTRPARARRSTSFGPLARPRTGRFGHSRREWRRSRLSTRVSAPTRGLPTATTLAWRVPTVRQCGPTTSCADPRARPAALASHRPARSRRHTPRPGHHLGHRHLARQRPVAHLARQVFRRPNHSAGHPDHRSGAAGCRWHSGQAAVPPPGDRRPAGHPVRNRRPGASREGTRNRVEGDRSRHCAREGLHARSRARRPARSALRGRDALAVGHPCACASLRGFASVGEWGHRGAVAQRRRASRPA
jgi:hypothetical protein